MRCGKTQAKWREDVDRVLQSEVEGCDWWKQKRLLLSFIHLNSCGSHERTAADFHQKVTFDVWNSVEWKAKGVVCVSVKGKKKKQQSDSWLYWLEAFEIMLMLQFLDNADPFRVVSHILSSSRVTKKLSGCHSQTG